MRSKKERLELKELLVVVVEVLSKLKRRKK